MGHYGIILLLFETPSGFAIFTYYGVQLFLPNAKENIWSKFVKNHKTHLVNKRIIETAGILYDCDLCLKKHSDLFRRLGHHLVEVSQIDTQGWSSMKLATAIKIVCCPFVTTTEYEEILKLTCLDVYGEMVCAHSMKANALEHMKLLVREAREAYEAEQAKKAYEAEQAKAQSR
ncbi:hypothetical protein GQ55_7G312000 [Panicum hallii var. hallii]|uniref:Uncharacterized protein n=1 Tax=Panicum hallii var. hallii TaxID=1504633 RepID=A0A2T7D0Z8_9POAL|nr:hypothetical protein GQ55_7G312000 [Panicum hallii var. hallii]